MSVKYEEGCCINSEGLIVDSALSIICWFKSVWGIWSVASRGRHPRSRQSGGRLLMMHTAWWCKEEPSFYSVSAAVGVECANVTHRSWRGGHGRQVSFDGRPRRIPRQQRRATMRRRSSAWWWWCRVDFVRLQMVASSSGVDSSHPSPHDYLILL